MKEKIVIFKCDVHDIENVREHLDAIAAMTNGKVWFETVAAIGYYNIICHYSESKFDWEKWQLKLNNSTLENKLKEMTQQRNDLEKDNESLKRQLRMSLGRLDIHMGHPSCVEIAQTLDRRIKSIEEELAWDKWKNDLPDICCSNRIDTLCGEITAMDDRVASVEGEVEAIKESIGTDDLQEQLEKDFADVYTEFQSTKDKVNEIEFGYIDMECKMSSAIDEMTKVKETVKGLNSLVATLGERNGVLSDKLDDYKEAYKHLNNADEALERRIKDLEKKSDDCTKRMNNFSKELNKFDTAINILVKDNGSIAREHLDDNKVINNTFSTIDACIDDFDSRLKALEKRLNIKPFYAPTEDEKDDD